MDRPQGYIGVCFHTDSDMPRAPGPEDLMLVPAVGRLHFQVEFHIVKFGLQQQEDGW